MEIVNDSLALIGQVVSEEIFEIVDGRTAILKAHLVNLTAQVS